METAPPEPAPGNDYLLAHADQLLRSYHAVTGRDLLDPGSSAGETARLLYHAPFALLSHDNAPDPLFQYANLAAQARFEMCWSEIVGLPSRRSAEPAARGARAQLLEKVRIKGYIDDYSGVRIAKSGRRFLIRKATIWNLDGGQAAVFSDWQEMENSGTSTPE